MSSLEELLPSGEGQRLPVAQAEGRLEAIVGDAVAMSAAIDHEAERQRLQGMVGNAGEIGAVGDARAVAALPSAAATRTKARSRFLRRQRRDWLTLIAAAAAVVAVAAAGFMGVKTAMATTPTDDSRTLLTDSEEALVSTISATNAERERLEAGLADTLAQADHAATALGAMVGVIDESSRVALIAARDSYVARVRAIEVPAALDPFEATPIAANATLSEIGAALEIVDARQLEVDAVKAEIRDQNATLVAERDALGALVKPLADSMIVLAGAEILQRAAALPEFRAAVQSAANGVAAARSSGRMGWVEMQALGEAIRALRVDDARALLEGPADEGTSGGSGGDWNGDSGGGSNGGPGDTPAPPDPGTGGGGPTDGGATDGGATDGGATDGGATDGGATDGGSTDGGSTDGAVVFPVP